MRDICVVYRNCGQLHYLRKVGRMMMNICGLIMNDPEYTVHLKIIQFASGPNGGSEIEEVARG